MASYKQTGLIQLYSFIGTYCKVILSGDGKDISFDFKVTAGCASIMSGPIYGEWTINPKDLPNKVRVQIAGGANGAGGLVMQIKDKNKDYVCYGQFISSSGGLGACMIDDVVKI